MSMDFNGREPEKPITDQEGVMFAAQPVWERSRKKKGFGRSKAAAPIVTPEPRSFAAERDYDEPMALDQPVAVTPAPSYARTEYAAMDTTNSTLAADEPVGLAAPIAGTRNTRPARSTRSVKSGSAAPAVIAAAVVGLGALGATGWYLSREPAGVPELAAGSTSESEMAATPLIPSNPPAQVAVNEAAAPPAVATPRVEAPRTSAPTARTTARARPAAASAGETGVNASTTAALPDGPQPYTSAPGAAPTEVNPPLVTLPPAASAAPAAVPATPPVATPEPAPTTEAPQTATPPQ